MMAPGRRSKCCCTNSVSSAFETLPVPKDSTRIETGYNRKTFYGGDVEGYTDYPVYDAMAPA